MEDLTANLSFPQGLDDENISLPGLVEIAPVRTPEQPSRRFTPAFGPGDLIGNRFRILAFVARGGMGEVYEAEDLELQETIALKTVLPAIAIDANVLALLRSEVQLSRKVTHPNVCRIFDLVCHRSNSPEVPPVWFVTMELLKGHTLTQEIQKMGKLPEHRALPLALQMADGLGAAHRAQIVHGDFKSSNILLVPLADGTLRAVITDFGLARTLEAAKDSRAASIGTPAYMAPEQVRGDALSPRTDVYSFGVVLYEMVCGQWPFNADTPQKIATKRLTEAPTPPVRFVPNLDPVWNRVILKCLERDPAQRYESATDAMDQITGRAQHRSLIVGVTAILLLMTSGWTALARYKELYPFRPKPQIAVMGWRNRSGNPALQSVSTELSERLTSVLEATTSDTVVPQQEIDRAKIEFSIPTDRDLEKEDLSQFRTALGANSFVLGSYDIRGPRLTIDGVLQNTKGRTVARFHEEGSIDNLTPLVANISTALATKLDSKEASAEQLDNSASIYPKTTEGRRLYFEALEELRSFDAGSAKDRLLQVLALEPNSVGVHAALAEAWFGLKHDSEAVEESKAAALLAQEQNLPPELLHATEARYAELQQKWSEAAASYKSLHDYFPSQLKYSLSYADALTKDGHPADALKFLDSLSRNPSPVGDDPRIQVLRAKAFAAESKFPDQVRAAEQCLAYATRRREKLMQATARLEICEAQQNTSQYANALEACEAARSIFLTFDDTVNAAVALNNEANIKMQQSDYQGAREAYQHVLAITQHADAEMDSAGALLNMANAEINLGDEGNADQHLRQSIELAHRIEDHRDESRARILLGMTLEDTNKLSEARDQYQKALEIAEAIGDRDAEAYAWSNLGQVAADQHSFALAEADLQKALALRMEMQKPSGIAKLELRLADVALQRGNTAQSRILATKAKADAEKLGDHGTAADSQSTLAEINLSSGDIAASLQQSEAAIALYRLQHDADSEAKTHLLRARAFLRTHDTQAAAQEVDAARQLPGVTDTTRTEAAKVQGALDKAARPR